VIERAVTPAGPYSLALSARLAGDATRVFRDGTLDAVVLPWAAGTGRAAPGYRGVAPGAAPERAAARQHPDGTVVLRAETEGGIAALRFQLALDDDLSPFHERFAGDPLLGPVLRELRGLRPIRVGTVAQALLRALCGQLIEASRARAIERAVVRAVTPAVGEHPDSGRTLHAPPTAAQLAALSPARLRALGLHARRGAALVRVCHALDPERLHSVATATVAARLERERGLGPWSTGVVCIEGLGRPERGLVGDLGLVVLLGQLLGRRAEGHETTLLLDRYGEWAGLAGFFLLAGVGRGLVPTDAGLPAAA
jgi:AraC family transcriptional regulator of adaptative response / DNA-3-methyladenine glycosylase II